MSFNIAEAKKVIPTLRSHQFHPGGNIMLAAADLLDSAIGDTANSMSQVRTAEAETMKVRKDYENALLEIKELREKADLGASAIEMLKIVAATKKGASAAAKDWLVNAKIVEPEAPKAN